jgi:glycerophosphoryl diester phosphodiesterase
MKLINILIATFGLMISSNILAQTQETRVIAHRGGRMEHEENTLQAFAASNKAGISGFETDVRMTKDGQLVISHDSKVDRMTNGSGAIEDLTAKEIRGLSTKQGNKVLFLNELIEFFKDKKGLYVEFEMKTDPTLYPDEKIPEYCDKVYKAVMKNKPKDAVYVLSSFDYRPLRYLKSHYPDAEILLITSKPCNSESIALCKALGTKRLAAVMNGTSRADIQKAHKDGMIINLWPGGSVDDFLLGAYLGSDIVCMDIPNALKEWLKTNGKTLNVKF